jgi:hypothetical protein
MEYETTRYMLEAIDPGPDSLAKLTEKTLSTGDDPYSPDKLKGPCMMNFSVSWVERSGMRITTFIKAILPGPP